MTKLNMVLNSDDENRINWLKETLGLTQNTELVRFVLAYTYDAYHKQEEIARNG